MITANRDMDTSNSKGKTAERAPVSAWDVPPGKAEAWLTEVLRREVHAVSATPLPACITLGVIQKLTVVLSVEEKLSKTTLVLKTESANPGANVFAAKAKCYSTEHTFYTALSRKCLSRVPKCFYSSISPEATAATLLLQHITPGTPGDTHEGLTLEQAQAAVVELAKFHASYFDDEESIKLVKNATEHVSAFDSTAAIDAFMAVWGDALLPFVDESGNNAVKSVFEHCAAHAHNWKDLLQVGIPSIVHGDYKGTNLILGEGGQSATILDFQTLYAGMKTGAVVFLRKSKIPMYSGGEVARMDDLCYLLVGSMETVTRAAHEKALLKLYRDTFESALPAEKQYDFFPSEEEMMVYYKMATQGMVYRCLNFNLILSGLSREACREQLHSLVTRTTLAIIDHELHKTLHVGRDAAEDNAEKSKDANFVGI